MNVSSGVVWRWVFLLCACITSVSAGEAKPTWEKEWNETVEAAIDPVFSLRDDVPMDPAVEPYRPKPGAKFMSVYGAEFRDLQGAHKVIDEALKR